MNNNISEVENGISRLDRQQAATDIGRTVKMLALDLMMRLQSTSLDSDSSLYKNTSDIRNRTVKITGATIGDEYMHLDKSGDYIRFFSKVPYTVDRYVDYAGKTIAAFIDGVMAARFYSEADMERAMHMLEEIYEAVESFNKEANHMHNMSNITIVEKKENNKGFSKK